MAERLSKSQIDRLGDRLRREAYDTEELRLLDEYRRTFGAAYDRVVQLIQVTLGVPVSGRPAKSTTSIIEKLQRESIRLSQMQDIAGCRVVVGDLRDQELAISAVKDRCTDIVIVDRRIKPSHGYRAVHFLIYEADKPIEVQLRTMLQHVWAELCEKSADIFDPAVKYGGGPSEIRNVLDRASLETAKVESLESALIRANATESKVGQELRDAREVFIAELQSVIKRMSDDMKGPT